MKAEDLMQRSVAQEKYGDLAGALIHCQQAIGKRMSLLFESKCIAIVIYIWKLYNCIECTFFRSAPISRNYAPHKLQDEEPCTHKADTVCPESTRFAQTYEQTGFCSL